MDSVSGISSSLANYHFWWLTKEERNPIYGVESFHISSLSAASYDDIDPWELALGDGENKEFQVETEFSIWKDEHLGRAEEETVSAGAIPRPVPARHIAECPEAAKQRELTRRCNERWHRIITQPSQPLATSMKSIRARSVAEIAREHAEEERRAKAREARDTEIAALPRKRCRGCGSEFILGPDPDRIFCSFFCGDRDRAQKNRAFTRALAGTLNTSP